MLRFLADQNFDGDIVRGLLRSIPNLDIVTAHEQDLSEAPDPDLLEWAASHERVVLTHDRRTMPDHSRGPDSRRGSNVRSLCGSAADSSGPGYRRYRTHRDVQP
ncbi:MAG: DUF5615 family PIN-like protein [Acidobacteriota bacterium]